MTRYQMITGCHGTRVTSPFLSELKISANCRMFLVDGGVWEYVRVVLLCPFLFPCSRCCCTSAIFLLSLFAVLSLCFTCFPMGPPDLSLRTLVTRQTDQVRRSQLCHTHFETHIDRIAQITILTSQLEASLACSANLRTRLSNTLDTLDTLQAELDAERRKNDKHLWMNLIQELQREKEEMQEVVESLIRRGKLFAVSDCLRYSGSPTFERSTRSSREIQRQI